MGSWFADSSGKLTCEGTELSMVEDVKQSTKFNALWKDGEGLSVKRPGARKYTVNIVSAGKGVWLGWCPESKFASGWGCKSFSYGGNLSDGGGLKRQKFGPWLKAGDEVGMFAEITNGKLVIMYSVNGVGLGEAFHIEDAESLGSLYLLASFNGGETKISISSGASDNFNSVPRGPPTLILGEWKFLSNQLVDTQTSIPIQLCLEDDQRLNAKVANQIFTQLAREPPHAAIGEVGSTMMMPPPQLVAIEEAVSNMLRSINSVSLDSGKLLIKYGNQKSISAVVSEPIHSPVTKEEISWM